MDIATPIDAGTPGASNFPKRPNIGGCAAHTASSAKRSTSSLEKHLRSSKARCCRTRKRLNIHRESRSRNKYTKISGSENSVIFLKKFLGLYSKLSAMDIKHQSVFLRRTDGTWGLNMRPRSESNASPPETSKPPKPKPKRAGRKKRKKSSAKQSAEKPKAKTKAKRRKKIKPCLPCSTGTPPAKPAEPDVSAASVEVVEPPEPSGPPKVFHRRRRRAKEAAKRKISSGARALKVLAPKPKPSKPKAKMQSVSVETTPEILQMEGSLVPSETTVEAETQNLNRNNSTAGFDGWLEAEIRQMLQDSTQEQFCLETDARVDQLREDLPKFTRKEEDAMLVEVSPRSPYACEMGRSCESIKMSALKGISPPIVLGAVRKEGFSDYKQCLLCLRNTATATLLRLRMDRVGMVRDGCLQTHANYCNINGEYRKEDCLPIRRDRYEGIVLPIVVHRNSGYRARELRHSDDTKTRFWCQKEGYPYPNMSMTAAPEDTNEEGSFLSKEPQTKAMN